MLKSDEYVSPKAIARWFVNRADRDSGEAITPLKVQKLVYYSQAWFLANFDRPLFKDDLEAWAHGPVHRGVYEKYRDSGWNALPQEARGQNVPDHISGFLSEIFSQYGIYSAKKLERMTHEEDPWRITRGDLPPEARCTKPIDKILMRNYYATRLGKKTKKEL